MRCRCPVFAALLCANAKSHERRTVVEIDADPIPSRGRLAEVIVGPLMVEPGLALDRPNAPRRCDVAGDGEMRKAVIAARLTRQRSFAAEASLTLQHPRLCRRKIERELDRPCGDSCTVASARKTQIPVVDMDVGRGFAHAREIEAGACGP